MMNSVSIQRDVAAETGLGGVVTVGNSLVTLDTLILAGLSDPITVEVVNLGSVAFSDFQIQTQVHPNSAWLTKFQAADFAASPPPLGALLDWDNVTDPGTLAGGAVTDLRIRMDGFHAVRFQAQTAGANTTANLRTTFRQVA